MPLLGACNFSHHAKLLGQQKLFNMECELVTQSMRNPKREVPFLLSRNFSPKPTNSSLKLYTHRLSPCNKNCSTPSLSSFRTRFSVSSSLATTEQHSIAANGNIPRKVLDPKTTKSVSFSAKNESFVDKKELLKRYSGILRECASGGALTEGESIHGDLIKSGLVPDSHLWVSLINFYAKCGQVVSSRKVLDEMPERDVVSWTALISGSVREGCGNEAVGLYSEMRKDNVRPNEFALATVLKACSACVDVGFGKQVHSEAIKAGMLLDLFVGSALVDVYAKCGEMELAGRVFSGMPEKNGVSWNALLNGYAQGGEGEEVLKLFSMMTESDMKSSPFTLSTVLKGCTSLEKLREGKVLHSMAIRSGCELDEFLSSSLVDMYCKCGMVSDALKVFNRITDPDVVAWSAMIAGLDQHGHGQEAADMFHRMRQRGVRPNQFSLSSLVSAATNMGNLAYGKSIHACIWKWGLESDNAIGNSLIMMYTRSGYVQDGFQVFEAMTDRDLVSCNALLSGFNELGSCDQGPRVFYQMLQEGFMPNIYTFIGVLRSCLSFLDLCFGQQVHAHVIKSSSGSDDFVGTALVEMYARCRCLEDACAAFNQLTARDVFVWTVVISGYAQTDQGEKAVKLFNQMQREGVMPNEFTLASFLSGCSRMATIETGQQLQSMAIKTGHLDDVFVATALVDMYEKCGCMEDAEAIFEGMVSRDTVSWNTIISGYSRHGQGKAALEYFRMMLDEGFVPDEATFMGVLSACSYMGLVEEGKMLFGYITQEYGIVPSIEHYACMVDILGRAGKFNEVEMFIKEMKLTNYSLIWETILGACKLHGNVELGERAAKKLFEIEPNMDSTYVLLSNIYASKGRWDDVKSIRGLMTSRGIKKEPGCSWVVVDRQVHVFMSQDGSHPKTKEIYAKLEELGKKLIEVGYVPKTENVLHDITDRERMEHLYHHSERLALAFVLISPCPTKTIRIFKNLRICEDCHYFMKLLSEITNQEIVVRDIKRFHHFKRGICSCQDHW